MIKVTTKTNELTLKPTIFPDGTSQVWKLPDWMAEARDFDITWNFESEREVIDLLSLRKLSPNSNWDLHIPFLPYARQDKAISNQSTFNLEVLADLINSLGCRKVTAVDAHNPGRTAELIKNFVNVDAADFQKEVVDKTDPEYIVFPDAGASARYKPLRTVLVCEKDRDQLTGAILGHKFTNTTWAPHYKASRFLIVDDLCDGGATFVSVAKMLREIFPEAWVGLCVTHGLFSKGREALLTNGINEIFTTNSLTKNEGDYKV